MQIAKITKANRKQCLGSNDYISSVFSNLCKDTITFILKTYSHALVHLARGLWKIVRTFCAQYTCIECRLL